MIKFKIEPLLESDFLKAYLKGVFKEISSLDYINGEWLVRTVEDFKTVFNTTVIVDIISKQIAVDDDYFVRMSLGIDSYDELADSEKTIINLILTEKEFDTLLWFNDWDGEIDGNNQY